MDFVGREGLGDDTDSQLKHYVAVIDPESKTWQLVEARRVTLRGAVRSKKNVAEEEESEEEMVGIFLKHGAIRIAKLTKMLEHDARSTYGIDQHLRYQAIPQGRAIDAGECSAFQCPGRLCL